MVKFGSKAKARLIQTINLDRYAREAGQAALPDLKLINIEFSS